MLYAALGVRQSRGGARFYSKVKVKVGKCCILWIICFLLGINCFSCWEIWRKRRLMITTTTTTYPNCTCSLPRRWAIRIQWRKSRSQPFHYDFSAELVIYWFQSYLDSWVVPSSIYYLVKCEDLQLIFEKRRISSFSSSEIRSQNLFLWINEIRGPASFLLSMLCMGKYIEKIDISRSLASKIILYEFRSYIF